MSIHKGDFIRLSFTGKLEDGTVFDTTDAKVAKEHRVFNEERTYAPMTIIVGSGFLVEGFEEDLIGKNAGDKASIRVPPARGFGERSLDAIEIVPVKKFDGEVSPGKIVDYNGRIGVIESISGGRVKVDYNEPLAGKTLVYDYSIDGIIEDKEDKIRALLKGYVSENATFELEGDTIRIDVPKELALDDSWAVGKMLIGRFLVASTNLKKVEFRERFDAADFLKPEAED